MKRLLTCHTERPGKQSSPFPSALAPRARCGPAAWGLPCRAPLPAAAAHVCTAGAEGRGVSLQTQFCVHWGNLWTERGGPLRRQPVAQRPQELWPGCCCSGRQSHCKCLVAGCLVAGCLAAARAATGSHPQVAVAQRRQELGLVLEQRGQPGAGKLPQRAVRDSPHCVLEGRSLVRAAAPRFSGAAGQAGPVLWCGNEPPAQANAAQLQLCRPCKQSHLCAGVSSTRPRKPRTQPPGPPLRGHAGC